MTASVLWTIKMLNWNLVLGNLRTMNNLSITNIFSNGMLYGKLQLMLLSQSRFKQLLSVSLTDLNINSQFVSAFSFSSLFADRRLWKVCSTKGAGYWLQFYWTYFSKVLLTNSINTYSTLKQLLWENPADKFYQYLDQSS